MTSAQLMLQAMSSRRRWWQRWLEMFVMEVRRPDGSTYLISIDPTGFGECWLPLDTIALGEDDVPIAV